MCNCDSNTYSKPKSHSCKGDIIQFSGALEKNCAGVTPACTLLPYNIKCKSKCKPCKCVTNYTADDDAIITNATAYVSQVKPNFFVLDGNNLQAFYGNHYLTTECGCGKTVPVWSRKICGLQAGDIARSIDFRPANGRLYLLANGYNRAHLYVLNLDDPCKVPATLVGPLVTELGSPIVLNGSYDIDFNPVVDRLRVVSSTGQNLRVDPNTALTIIDGNLAYAAGDVNFGKVPAVYGIAYTNNFVGATSTTLYAIDVNQQVLATQNPPNIGTLNTVGSLGFNVTKVLGFDIETITNNAYATFTVNNTDGLYRINLATGRATFIKYIDDTNSCCNCNCEEKITGFAIAIPINSTQIRFTLKQNECRTNITGIVNLTNQSEQSIQIPGRVCIERCDELSVLLEAIAPSILPANTNFVFTVESFEQ